MCPFETTVCFLFIALFKILTLKFYGFVYLKILNNAGIYKNVITNYWWFVQCTPCMYIYLYFLLPPAYDTMAEFDILMFQVSRGGLEPPLDSAAGPGPPKVGARGPRWIIVQRAACNLKVGSTNNHCPFRFFKNKEFSHFLFRSNQNGGTLHSTRR